MKITITFILISLYSISSQSQNSYKTESGITYKIGDTLHIGRPLNDLGWTAIYKDKSRKTYAFNRNLVNKKVIVKKIDTTSSPTALIFTIYRRNFYVNIDDALNNKEIIPSVKRQLTNKNTEHKYDVLLKLKKLLDSEAITQEEYIKEKKKILND